MTHLTPHPEAWEPSDGHLEESGGGTGRWPLTVQILLGLTIMAGLYLLSRRSYLPFHNLVELSSVIVAMTIFSIGWHARRFARDYTLLVLATAYLAVGVLDLLHALSYKGMGFFPIGGANLPTQFWLAARYLEAGAFLAAALLTGWRGKLSPELLLTLSLVIGLALVVAIYPLGVFPTCYLEGRGLTPFKIGSEYLICLLLAVAGFFLWHRRGQLNGQLLWLLLAAILFKILAEFSFTLYVDVYGFSNFLGHILKLTSIFFLYRALVEGSLRRPYLSLFRDLVGAKEKLQEELLAREMGMRERDELLLTLEQQRRLADERAREAEEGQQILNTLMEYLPEGITIADSGGKIRMVSRYGQELACRSLEELRPLPGRLACRILGVLSPGRRDSCRRRCSAAHPGSAAGGGRGQ